MCRDSRKVGGPSDARLRTRLLQTSQRRLQILVGGANTAFERIECRVLKYAPPCAARRSICGLRLLPIAHLAIGRGWRRGRRCLVGRCERTAAKRPDEAERKMRKTQSHEVSLSPRA